MNKLGPALGGDGIHGTYIAGVLDFFMEQNSYIDGVTGVSAGACHAYSYVSRQIGRAHRTNTAYLKGKCHMNVFSLSKTGDFSGVKFVYEDTPNTLNPYDFDAFNTSHTKLYTVASNLEIGKAEYLQCINMERDVIYARTSASLPLLSRIVEADRKKLLDGGAIDSTPIHKFQGMGCTKNIVVFTQCKEYHKGKNNLLPMIRRSYKKYPKFIKAPKARHIAYNRTLDELALMEKGGSVFLIRPSSSVGTSRLEKNEARSRELYEQGYTDAKNNFEELKFLIINES